jgi:hypothetical protein
MVELYDQKADIVTQREEQLHLLAESPRAKASESLVELGVLAKK